MGTCHRTAKRQARPYLLFPLHGISIKKPSVRDFFSDPFFVIILLCSAPDSRHLSHGKIIDLLTQFCLSNAISISDLELGEMNSQVFALEIKTGVKNPRVNKNSFEDMRKRVGEVRERGVGQRPV